MSTPQPPMTGCSTCLRPSRREWNGIDYVEIVSADQTRLRVHFLNTATVRGTLAASQPVTITGGETIGSVAVLPIDETTAWSADADGRPVLSLAVAAPGRLLDLHADDPQHRARPVLRRGQRSASRRAARATWTAPPRSPPARSPDGEPVPIDYLAKDFASFTQALSDFSAPRYPGWVERSEADIGVMLMEALSALADELSYLAGPGRRRGDARDRDPARLAHAARPARRLRAGARDRRQRRMLQLDVAPGVTSITAGLRCSALGADGQQIAVRGRRTAAAHQPRRPPTRSNPRWNAVGPTGDRNLLPYWWDDSRQCLTVGSRRLWLLDHGHQLQPGQPLLIDTCGASTADPHVREVVAIAPMQAGAPDPVQETTDPVFAVQITQINLAAPTTLDHDLSRTHLAGNLVPALQGDSATQTFSIPGAPQAPGTTRRLPGHRADRGQLDPG